MMLKKASSVVLAQRGLAKGNTHVLACAGRAGEKAAFVNIIGTGA
jgi:hypothetical protein